MPLLDWTTVYHFKPAEFACKCGRCGSDGLEMDMNFIFALDQLRERSGNAMVITSGYRCPAYNASISVTGHDGPHTTGRAADVGISGERAFHLIMQASLGGWMTGIGLNQTGPYEKRFIHLDDLQGPDHPRPRIWTY